MHTPTIPDQSTNLLDVIKPHIAMVGSILTGLGSLLLAIVIGFGNYQKHDTQLQDTTADLLRRVGALENSAATRREVEALATSFAEYKRDSTQREVDAARREIRIEDMLSQEVRYMRRDNPSVSQH